MRWTSRIAGAILCAVIQGCATPPLSGPGPGPGLSHVVPAEIRAPVTILVSIDAFRPDYLHHGATPNLDALAAAGAETTMRPSYPSLTFPNHTTLVTGLRPDHHGIVANLFFDPARATHFYNKEQDSLDPFWWAQAEPIWITAEKHGIRSGTMFWPGEEAAHDGVRPSDWLRFDANFTSAQRVRTVLDWMRRPADIRPAFVTLYFDEVDKTSHKQGPKAPLTIDAVREIDALVGTLKAGLDGLGQPVNLIVVSDHGMRVIQPERTVLVGALLPADSYRLVSYGPFATVDPLPGHEDAVARALLAPNPNMTCWRKADMPPRYHYGTNPRVAAFVCQAKAGGEVMATMPTNKGDHGYDVDDPDMTAVFIAAGPDIRGDVALPGIVDNVDLYPLLARLIGVAPLANDGDAETLAPLARARER